MEEPARVEEELLALNQKLLTSIASSDWTTYTSLCDPALTCFEPESRGQLVKGMPFHQYYFFGAEPKQRTHVTMSMPNVRLLGKDAAIICYVRLNQYVDESGSFQTSRMEETRVWQRIDGSWRHVHFHRSNSA